MARLHASISIAPNGDIVPKVKIKFTDDDLLLDCAGNRKAYAVIGDLFITAGGITELVRADLSGYNTVTSRTVELSKSIENQLFKKHPGLKKKINDFTVRFYARLLLEVDCANVTETFGL